METAKNTSELRRVAIDPVSRVEGHGKVTLLLDANNHVQQARLHIVEFRGFESFIVGRPYWEVPVMVQRLCGICPVSHHLAASKAIDAALGIDSIPHTALLMRRLMHYGQVMQSHALHFFHLCSPDLLFGFDSEVNKRNIMGVAAAHPEVARQGVLLRKYGQELIRMTAGKRIHGTGSIAGGVNRHLTKQEQNQLLAEVPQMLGWCVDAVNLVTDLQNQNRELYDGFGRLQTGWLSLVTADGELELYDGMLRARDAQGQLQLDGVEVQNYQDHIEERSQSWTYMKFPYLRKLGPENGWYRVGPLARIQNCKRISTPLAEAERQRFLADGPVHSTLAYHRARMIEMLHAMEEITAVLADDAVTGGELVTPLPDTSAGMPAERRGVGVIEAPRGTLIHDYVIDADDLISECNLIVSTTHNNQAMNESVRAVAKDAFNGSDISEGMLNQIEVAIRAYDPCLSCATHALGSMPLEVTLVDENSDLRDSLQRHSDGRLEHVIRNHD